MDVLGDIRSVALRLQVSGDEGAAGMHRPVLAETAPELISRECEELVCCVGDDGIERWIGFATVPGGGNGDAKQGVALEGGTAVCPGGFFFQSFRALFAMAS